MAQTLFSKVAAALLVAASLLAVPTPGAAQAGTGAELRMAELEKAFWACDHAATVVRIDSGTAMTCSVLYENLKQRKFNSDFNAMLAWWRQHKEAEHLALEARTPRADARGAALRQR